MDTISPDQKTFKNTFAPNCGNEELTVDMIIAALRTTVMRPAVERVVRMERSEA